MAMHLVTGGAGFIGSNIVAALLERGQQVRVLDNFSTGRRQNLAALEGNIEVVEGDLRSYHLVREAVEGADFVLHQGALPSVPRSVRDPITTNEVNVAGTLNVLQAARDAKVKRLVYASSSSVYGDGPELPKREDMAPRPLSPYSISKLAGEQYCQSFWRLYGFEAVCLRYFNVFGPNQDPSSQYAAVIPKFIKGTLSGETLVIHGDGCQSRDFSYVDNIVSANLLACNAPFAPGKVLNVACGDRHSLLDLIYLIHELTGIEPKVEFGSQRAGDVPHSQADIRGAQEYLGYQPRINFAEGLRRTVAWIQTQQAGRND